MAYVTVQVQVSGSCPTCGVTNNATVQAQADERSKVAFANADAVCGACKTPVHLTGSGSA